jgi:hypothetical protein
MSAIGAGALLSGNDQMEALSRAYVAAIAANAGYLMAVPDFDRDSIDVMLHAGGRMRPQIGIQLKATTGIAASVSSFKYSLKIKNYEDLRAETQVPRILVVLAMPKQSTSWLNHNPKRLILKRCAYWKSLAGAESTPNQTAINIDIDTTQVFDVFALSALMEKSRTGSAL